MIFFLSDFVGKCSFNRFCSVLQPVSLDTCAGEPVCIMVSAEEAVGSFSFQFQFKLCSAPGGLELGGVWFEMF